MLVCLALVLLNDLCCNLGHDFASDDSSKLRLVKYFGGYGIWIVKILEQVFLML